MSYLGRFWTSLCAIFLRLDRVPNFVSSGEPISRFIVYEGHINKTSGSISLEAFMPSPRTRDTSVYRTVHCSERKVWLIGDIFVARLRKDKRRIHGRADVKAKSVLQQELKIVPQLSPHPRHAIITKWPDDKPQQRVKAMALAQGATLRFHPRRGRSI